MPELPEIEIVKKGLTHLIRGKKINDVQVFWPKIIDTNDLNFFKLQLKDEVIESISRRGKFLIFHLSHFDLISHLRMEGKYVFFNKENQTKPMKHTHVVFHFSDNSQLHYQDVRKFGRFVLVPKNQSNEYPGIKKLGPEPILPDFDRKVFQKRLSLSSKSIKPLLLEQHLVTGLGNIYVDEVLWASKIHPETSANLLKLSEVRLLHASIMDVLARAIEAGGSTIRTYKNALGKEGTYQLQLHAYGKEGLPCDRCFTPLIKTKVAQRGTHFCPKCQKRRRLL